MIVSGTYPLATHVCVTVKKPSKSRASMCVCERHVGKSSTLDIIMQLDITSHDLSCALCKATYVYYVESALVFRSATVTYGDCLDCQNSQKQKRMNRGFYLSWGRKANSILTAILNQSVKCGCVRFWFFMSSLHNTIGGRQTILKE